MIPFINLWVVLVVYGSHRVAVDYCDVDWVLSAEALLSTTCTNAPSPRVCQQPIACNVAITLLSIYARRRKRLSGTKRGLFTVRSRTENDPLFDHTAHPKVLFRIHSSSAHIDHQRVLNLVKLFFRRFLLGVKGGESPLTPDTVFASKILPP